MSALDTTLLLNLAVTQLLQLTLLVVLVGLASRLLAERAPRLALVLWMLVFVKALTPPLWSAEFGVFSWMQAAAVGAIPEDAAVVTVPWAGDSLAGPAAAILCIWLAGSVGCAAGVLIRKRGLERRLASDRVGDDHELLAYARRLAAAKGLRSPDGLVVSSDEIGPAVAGVSRPMLVLPRSLVEKSDAAQLRPVILHELVHADRRDTLAAAVACLVRAVWWFHPLVWWATREADRLTERCVDMTIVRDLGSGLSDYARGLFRVLEMRSTLRVRDDLVGLKPCQITLERLAFLRRFARGRLGRSGPGRGDGLMLWSRWSVFAVLAAALLPSLPVDALNMRCALHDAPCGLQADAQPAADATPVAAVREELE